MYSETKRTPTTSQEIARRIQDLLLEELKQDGNRRWFYISCASTKEFLFGCFVQAMGPVDANTTIHRLGWYPRDSEASTEIIEVPENLLVKIPKDFKWRKLTKEEVISFR